MHCTEKSSRYFTLKKHPLLVFFLENRWSVRKKGIRAEQRKELIVDMWIIAKADGVIDPMEEFVIRKVADLLYVSHSDFIYGKVHSLAST